MVRTRRGRRGYSAGEWGRNRVRVFPDPKTGRFQVEWRENGRRRSRSLGHRDWVLAKRQADEFAAGLADPEMRSEAEAAPERITMGALLDTYGEEVTPTKARKTQVHDRAAGRMFLELLGRNRDPETLSRRDWDRFIRERRAGRVGPSGKPASNRTIEHDLKFLIAVLNWAVTSKDESGRPLLASNPLKGLKTPKPRTPVRVVLTEEEYQALLEVSEEVDWRFNVALVLAHETGHRIGAIRKLRWSDIDLDGRTVLWRAEHDKTGHEHTTPITADAMSVLRRALAQGSGARKAPVLPALGNSATCVGSSRMHQCWYRAERLAGLEPKPRRGWHSLRRKFASDLMDLPLKVLCELGGWRRADTVLRCYQHTDLAQLREALDRRGRATT